MNAWTSKTIGLSSLSVHRKSPLAPFSSKTWRRNRSVEHRRCVLTNHRSSTHSPTSQDSQECGKPRPRCCLWGRWHWSGDELGLLSWFRPDGLVSPAWLFRFVTTGGRFRTALERLKAATRPYGGLISESVVVFHGLEPCFQLSDPLCKSTKYC